jgi:(2S)-methylsuccinyl-CoA dehydrogenase
MPGPSSDLAAARAAVELAHGVVDRTIGRLAAAGATALDDEQVVAYDVAHAAAAVAIAAHGLEYGENGDVESQIATAFAADAVADVVARTVGREEVWVTEPGWHAPAAAFLAQHRSPDFLAGLAQSSGPRHLDDDFTLVLETFRRFAEDRIRPRAEEIHRRNEDIPEELIAGLAELGGFGLSVPAELGGFASGGEQDYLGMVVATEELSRGSLGVGGSLVTRPEILTRALVNGGTEEQQQRWLPRIAAGELMVAVAVTEPDFGSDVASLTFAATRTDGGWVLNGVKTWCTFAGRADVLMLLARTDPDRSKGHKGLSLFVVDKPRAEGHTFEFTQDAGGKMEGRAIDTLGYRGMHSYEVSFDGWTVGEDALVGGEEGLGKGFYLQMAGFENGRLQTAARALGLMQAAYEAALEYSKGRKVFGRPILEYQLTKAKLGRMVAVIQACRQYAYQVARMMAAGAGTTEASMVKAYACRAAEWVTREALQIHGGMGYAEEFPVSRYFVDARVLSIFEGADETLCLKVIARRLVAGAGA